MGTEARIIVKVLVFWGLAAALLAAAVVVGIEHLRLVWVP